MKPHRVPQLVHDRIGCQKLPECAGEYEGTLLIVSSGRCVWEDVRTFRLECDVLAINDMIPHWPGPLKHCYSNHGDGLSDWLRATPFHYKKYRENVQMHSFKEMHIKNYYHWPVPGRGSSGLCAILVALGLGYDEIFVAGMPLDESGHFTDPPNDHPLWDDSRRKPSNFVRESPDRLWEPLIKCEEFNRVHFLSGRIKDLCDQLSS